jgi:hypothetical protein
LVWYAEVMLIFSVAGGLGVKLVSACQNECDRSCAWVSKEMSGR